MSDTREAFAKGAEVPDEPPELLTVSLPPVVTDFLNEMAQGVREATGQAATAELMAESILLAATLEACGADLVNKDD
jgi:hypothetical protein